jgi:hypothetical protein
MPRPQSLNLDSAIRALVAEEVARVLFPHQNTLSRLEGLFGTPGARAAVKGSVKGAAKGRKASRKADKAKRIDWARYAEGAKVTYQVGRGTFDAKIVAIDKDSGLLTLERAKDKKKFQRAAAKVSLAA